MTSTVACLNSWLRRVVIEESGSKYKFDIASSRTMILGFHRIAQQMLSNWASPKERLAPFSSIRKVKSLLMFDWTRISYSYSSENTCSGSRLNLKGPLNRIGHWGITATYHHKSS